jgi:manganese/zinc/iron transport system permease protein
MGFPMRFFEILLTFILVLAIVLGLQTVGVVLMSAMIVSPGAAARQWTNRLGRMVILSSVFGAFSGVTGALLSSVVPNMPTGPTIVLVLAFVMVVSLFFAKGRGLVWRFWERRTKKRQFAIEALLQSMYSLASQHEDKTHSHSIEAIRMLRSRGEGVQEGLKALQRKGYVRNTSGDKWAITQQGLNHLSEESQKFGGAQ